MYTGLYHDFIAEKVEVLVLSGGDFSFVVGISDSSTSIACSFELFTNQ